MKFKKALIISYVILFFSYCKKGDKKAIESNNNSSIIEKENFDNGLYLRISAKKTKDLRDTISSQKFDINFDGEFDIEVFAEIKHLDTIPYTSQYIKILNSLIYLNTEQDNKGYILKNQFINLDYITTNSNIQYSNTQEKIIINEYKLHDCIIKGQNEICLNGLTRGMFIGGKPFIAFTIHLDAKNQHDKKIGYIQIINSPLGFSIEKIGIENTLNKPIQIIEKKY